MACTRAATRSPEGSPAPVAALIEPVTAAAGGPEAAPAVSPVAEPELAIRSAKLRNGELRSPMPGGWIGGWYGDTGLDVAGDHLDVFAIAAGTLDYAEWGHTRWTRGKDTAFSVRLALDEPIRWSERGERGERRITHVYYTHMSRVEHEQAEGAKERRHVRAGERIGVSGIGNGTPHLHLGLLLEGQVEQDSWEYILREGEVRKVMGGYRNGERFK